MLIILRFWAYLLLAFPHLVPQMIYGGERARWHYISGGFAEDLDKLERAIESASSGRRGGTLAVC